MNKKTKKKIKSFTRSAAKETRVLMKKADKQVGKMAKAIQKEWKETKPQREKYKAELEVAAKKAGKEGARLLKIGLKNGIKIGGDVFDVVRKDVREMNKKKTK